MAYHIKWNKLLRYLKKYLSSFKKSLEISRLSVVFPTPTADIFTLENVNNEPTESYFERWNTIQFLTVVKLLAKKTVSAAFKYVLIVLSFLFFF